MTPWGGATRPQRVPHHPLAPLTIPRCATGTPKGLGDPWGHASPGRRELLGYSHCKPRRTPGPSHTPGQKDGRRGGHGDAGTYRVAQVPEADVARAQQEGVMGLWGHKGTGVRPVPWQQTPPAAPWFPKDRRTATQLWRLHLAADEQQPHDGRVYHRLGDVGAAALQLPLGEQRAVQFARQLHQRGSLQPWHGSGTAPAPPGELGRDCGTGVAGPPLLL